MLTRIITIGDEILIGQILDTNANWIAREVRETGGQLLGKTTVGDDEKQIRLAIERGFEDAEVILMTGGLGPTRDDITKKAIADHFGVGLVFSQETHAHIAKLFERFGRPMLEAHRQQCFMPQNAKLLTNKMGSAPGMWFEKDGKVLVSMPGVPYEMKHLMTEKVLPKLKQSFQPRGISYRTILTAGKGETQIAEAVESFEDNLPEELKLAYLPGLARVRLRLTAVKGDPQKQEALLKSKGDELIEILGEDVFGEDDISLSEALGKLLVERGLTMGTAESCTGGYLAHLITSVPGASRYYEGSFLTYSNRLKEQILGVSPKTLETVGAVSEETVREMLKGLLKNLGVDVGVAISGIMGPGGGTEEKPVGTVWIAFGDSQNPQTIKLSLGKTRDKNIEYTAIKALNELRLYLLKH
ncbi:MAG: competence/damage-inducible protein A [Bacteroidetes bacterium]|nr:competence/damage-inducible protein A [Bacteroidota bacterium]